MTEDQKLVAAVVVAAGCSVVVIRSWIKTNRMIKRTNARICKANYATDPMTYLERTNQA